MSSTDPELIESPINNRRGARITLRTCLLLALILTITFSLSIGVSFRSQHHCFAGTCGEWLFPRQARAHVAIWYSWLSLSATFLGVRAFHPEIQKFLARPLSARALPLIKKQLSIGGCLLIFWIAVLYGVIISNWWIRLHDYFVERGKEGGIFSGGERLAAVALTGHMCDVTMGVVLLPISRHGALATAFNFSVSTTLTVHMLMAYLLFLLVSIHGLLYLSWIPMFNSLSTGLRTVIPVLNPTYRYNETWPGNRTSLGVWRASLIFTGSLTAIIMLGIFITTLPRIRAKHFNFFYFTHLLSTIMIVIICLHASTMFYCLAPGLAMWCLDWGIRVHELRKVLDGEITTVGNEWYCVSIPLPRSRLSGLPYQSPLAHFYIHHAVSSILELHPFTTITHLKSLDQATPATDDYFMVQFLFRKRGKVAPFIPEEDRQSKSFRLWSRGSDTKIEDAKSGQWTERLAGLVDQEPSPVRRGSVATVMSVLFPRINVALRLEGPYFSPAQPSRYDKVICFVAGTGISGAIAIATAFTELNRTPTETPSTEKPNGSFNNSPVSPWRRCIVIWSVRATDFVDLPFFEYKEGLEIRNCLTGPGRQRLNLNQTLGEILTEDPDGKTWVYISGPKPFIEAGKMACKAREDVDLYAASWDI